MSNDIVFTSVKYVQNVLINRRDGRQQY